MEIMVIIAVVIVLVALRIRSAVTPEQAESMRGIVPPPPPLPPPPPTAMAPWMEGAELAKAQARAAAAAAVANEEFRKEAAYMAASFRNGIVPVSRQDYLAAKAAKDAAEAAALAAADAAWRAKGYF